MVILMDILSVLGFFLTIVGLIYMLVLIIKKLRKKKITYKFIFISFFILLTGINFLWVVEMNPVKINTNSIVTTSNDYPKPISLNLKTIKNVDFNYDSRYISMIERNGVPSFSIKSTDLKTQTTLTIKQNYYNEFLVPVKEVNQYLVKKE